MSSPNVLSVSKWTDGRLQARGATGLYTVYYTVEREMVTHRYLSNCAAQRTESECFVN